MEAGDKSDDSTSAETKQGGTQVVNAKVETAKVDGTTAKSVTVDRAEVKEGHERS